MGETLCCWLLVAGCCLLLACSLAGWLAAAGDEVLESKLFGVPSRDAIGAPVQERWLAGGLSSCDEGILQALPTPDGAPTAVGFARRMGCLRAEPDARG